MDADWDASVVEGQWVLLPHEHPDYWIQQAFSEVACRSRETDPGKLFDLAIADYETIDTDPDTQEVSGLKADDRIRDAFRKWSAIQAANNDLMAKDPWMQGLEAAEAEGEDACDKFLRDNPNGPFKPLGKESGD